MERVVGQFPAVLAGASWPRCDVVSSDQRCSWICRSLAEHKNRKHLSEKLKGVSAREKLSKCANVHRPGLCFLVTDRRQCVWQHKVIQR